MTDAELLALAPPGHVGKAAGVSRAAVRKWAAHGVIPDTAAGLIARAWLEEKSGAPPSPKTRSAPAPPPPRERTPEEVAAAKKRSEMRVQSAAMDLALKHERREKLKRENMIAAGDYVHKTAIVNVGAALCNAVSKVDGRLRREAVEKWAGRIEHALLAEFVADMDAAQDARAEGMAAAMKEIESA